jgi:N-acylneuraminate cytidylyltransferase
VPGKNVRELAGHPLIAYSIAGARSSGLFDAVIVSTDSEEIADVAARYGAEVPGLRPAEIASPTSPDVEWVRLVLAGLEGEGRRPELFSILRPTSPFRAAGTIVRAHEELLSRPEADSIRAVELCRQHPGKMWTLEGELMRPLLSQPDEGVPTHSRQYQDLPEIYVQNSSLEMAWTRAVTEQGSIAGETVAPFFTDGVEGLTIDYPSDWAEAERLVAEGAATLPAVDRVAV